MRTKSTFFRFSSKDFDFTYKNIYHLISLFNFTLYLRSLQFNIKFGEALTKRGLPKRRIVDSERIYFRFYIAF